MLVEFKDVVKTYGEGEGKQIAVDHVSFSIDEGEFVVILGQSGAGKSTILNMLGGMDTPTQGMVTVAGREISGMKSIVKNAADADKLLDMVGLSKCRNKFPAQMSGGEQQRVSIARALAKNPKILLGDEPTGALDSETGIIVLELLQRLCREEKKTVIIVTHNSDIAKCADKVIRMKNGKVKAITINENPLDVKEVDW